MWVLGGNFWARAGNTFSIGTPSTNACLNIATDGSVLIPYKLTVGGVIYRYQPVPATQAEPGTVMVKILTGILTNAYTTASTVTLPTGTAVYSSILAINQSIDWSLIHSGTATGTVTVVAAAASDHTVFGSMVVPIGTSGAFRTRVSALNVAITYRMS